MKIITLTIMAFVASATFTAYAAEFSCKVYASNEFINDQRTVEARVKNTTDKTIGRFSFLLNVYDCSSIAKYLSDCDKIAEETVIFGESENDTTSYLNAPRSPREPKEVSVYIPAGQTRTYKQTVAFDYILSANGALNYSCTDLNTGSSLDTEMREIIDKLMK